ncbi:uncharacterized protein LOC125239300 [Leguminivora glycinivorella]|uniref:uncharacterized protein LOC125239300 n=1 Tax=Leguminivora glycinivorella TaxID=1035111 RepID=UPI00200D610E|nr:uncharacterized protein LOC125239300 [Leguminivora glycinivorella]XP_048002799.1 uncharacterized protein LOC125239300 [Leguminivora glycinivorella]XP_048002800.1 uncharacterized protein LOC125239300 [Leguminivora glycinivorella]
MTADPKSKLSELQATISKMSLEACCVAVLPELGLLWGDVSRAIRGSRLPMTPASAARVLCRHIARSLPAEEYDDLLNRLKLKLVATQNRVWHLVSLSEPESDEPVSAAAMTSRVRHALRKAKAPKNMTTVVESVNIGDLVYFSVQLVSATKQGNTLYCAVPPGRPVALLSTLGAKTMLKAIVEGLGYKTFTDESLHGRDIPSLLRVHARGAADHEDILGAPEYRPQPLLTDNGIDFTYKGYNEEYMEQVMGPSPPLMTDLKIQTSEPFFDPNRLKKNINLTIELKSTDIASTLKQWVKLGALKPTSPLVQIFHQTQSNSIVYQRDD